MQEIIKYYFSENLLAIAYQGSILPHKLNCVNQDTMNSLGQMVGKNNNETDI